MPDELLTTVQFDPALEAALDEDVLAGTTGSDGSQAALPASIPAPAPAPATDVLAALEDARRRQAGADRRASQLENDLIQTRNQLLQMQQQMMQPAPQAVPVGAEDGSYLSDDEATAYAQAVAVGDTAKIKQISAIQAKRIQAEATKQMVAIAQQASVQSSQTSAWSRFLAKNGITDQNSAAAKLVNAEYQRIINDPDDAAVAGDQAGAMKMAVAAVRAQLKGRTEAAETAARSDNFVATESGHPATGAAKPATGRTVTKDMFFPYEIKYVSECRDRGEDETLATYFAALPPEVQAARLKTGKPFTVQAVRSGAAS